MSSYSLPPVAPAMLRIAALVAGKAQKRRPPGGRRLAEAAGMAAFAVAVLLLAVLVDRGPGASLAARYAGAGLGVRLDAISATVMVPVAFVGWVVVRCSVRAPDGEARQGPVLGRTVATPE
ncbi:MAG: hypothetical protein HXX10_09005 [Rhodoplanes sp.]|uniref:hypothetical protein n=1 Tax=Rhodoplanes sp. TaxID=1968906 RepID=UPI00184CD092|nr:hypothetical protein [Rhodoplanes sp.]NVO14160.1 hypothetical protein [Rhodoplanes sp.]